MGQDTRRREAVLAERVQSLDLLREIRAEIDRSTEEIVGGPDPHGPDPVPHREALLLAVPEA
ncbi:hypothetical protein [Rubellimicrobium roseum]|uniref:Uncharacterized protein n=1 Tax=Rubellimicrobium roseum TaxID=687525 RepID=A0A5C4NDT9_9RHOB|nr:hypothetical protein [Rubellimicrobium roseum]TNC67539.1 hypothetical protein FHG71_15655 [Rubellimicrobium roseum]